MSILDKLKSWYTFDEAAARLSRTLGQEVTHTDLVQMAADGHIVASWHLNGEHQAIRTTVTCLYPKGDYICLHAEYERDADGNAWRETISGPFQLPVGLYPPWGWWLLTLIGKGGESGTLWDALLVDPSDGSYWALCDANGGDFMHFPPSDQIVLLRQDIEAFEIAHAADSENAASSPANSPAAVVPSGAGAALVTRNKLRTNTLDIPIKKAIEAAKSQIVAAVYLELRKLALAEEPPFTGQLEGDALCYTNDNQKAAKLTKNALAKRLKNLAL